MEYFHQILPAYKVLHCLDTGIQNNDKASPSISEAGHGFLVKCALPLNHMVYFDQLSLTYTF